MFFKMASPVRGHMRFNLIKYFTQNLFFLLKRWFLYFLTKQNEEVKQNFSKTPLHTFVHLNAQI